MNETQQTAKRAVGNCVTFTIEKAPRGSLMKSGMRHSGYIRAIRGERVTIEDVNGYRFTVDSVKVRS